MSRKKNAFTVDRIRKIFLEFFQAKGHTVVPSSPLVPGNDPTLMFTNSGMVQFKDVFLGLDKRAYVRAASVQTCLRAGGKHNDLENVGYTARHHTFFEMLGNWSFGDYFKLEAILWSWELLTKVYGLDADRLMATVYHEDDEAYDIWTRTIGLPPSRVVRIGDNKGGKYKSDNFWMMADTGPCGPCSEIFYDHGPAVPGGPPGSAEEDGDRFIEIWNLVFMQFEMHADGSLTRLPAPCVDTGMGLERLAAILQGVHSNYEIDLFEQLIGHAAKLTGCSDLANPSLKVIADHIRATAFLVGDGVFPSNEGRGYVLRRIIRRAIRHGYKLGCKAPFFYKLTPALVTLMGDAYPRLASGASHIGQTLQAEEERFFETLETGMQILETALAESPDLLAGPVAFRLHDTYGFPLDLTQDVCRERGVAVDAAGFDEAMQRQRDKGRAAGKFRMERAVEYHGEKNVFTGYERQSEEARVVALYHEGAAVDALQSGQAGICVLDITPFYAESGGQAGDKGAITAGGVRFVVEDTQRIKADVFGHHGRVESVGMGEGGALHVGQTVEARVNEATRAAAKRNHSATHLMHKALREVLGSHVEQRGSQVDDKRTRFDFAHNSPLTQEQLFAVERLVNAQITNNSAAQTRIMDIDEARRSGAMMLFGEKYGESVRVVGIGSSLELCGGTHVERSGDIGFFTIEEDSAVAAGVRRIEALTGPAAVQRAQDRLQAGLGASLALNTNLNMLPDQVANLLDRQRTLEKEIALLKARLASAQGDELLGQAHAVGSIKVLAARIEGADARSLRETLDKLKDKLGSAAIVLACVDGEKVQLAAGVTANLIGRIKAGDLVNFVAAQVGGKGGGKPDMAMAGGTNPAKLNEALRSVDAWVAERVG